MLALIDNGQSEHLGPDLPPDPNQDTVASYTPIRGGTQH